MKKVKWVKAAAREHVGQPKPTRVQKSSARKKYENRAYVVDALGEYFQLTDRSISSEKAPNQMYTSAQLHPVVTRHAMPKNYIRSGKTYVYDEEVVAHLNYLQQSKGDQAVADYLNNPAKPVGSIQQTLHEAREKMQFYQRQALEAEREHGRWRLIADQLQAALDILNGKTSLPVESGAPTTNHKIVKGRWKQVVLDYMRLPNTLDVTAGMLQDRLMFVGCPSKGAAYQAVVKMIKDGVLLQRDGLLYLPEKESVAAKTE